MNREQNVKFLTSLGIPKEKAEAMSKNVPTDAPTTPDADVEEAFQSAVFHQNDLYKNGEEYKTALKAKHQQALREITAKSEKKILSISGLTEDEIKDLDFDKIVDLAFKKASKTGDKTTEELQAELIKRDLKLKELEETVIPGIRSEVQTEKEAIKTRNAYLSTISKMKLREGTAPEDALILFESKLKNSGFKSSFNDKGELEILNADGSKILTEDKKGTLKSDDVFNKFLDGQIEKSNAPEGGKKKDIIEPEGGKPEKPANGSVVNANIEKSKKHAEMLKEQAGKL